MTAVEMNGVWPCALPSRRGRVHCIYAKALLGLLLTTTRLAAFDEPVANPDSATLQHEQKIWISVLENDNGDFVPTFTEIVAPPQHGTATVGTDGRVLYANAAGDTSAADSFTYRNGWSGGFSDPASVSISFSSNLHFFTVAPAIPFTPPALSVQVIPAFGNLSFTGPTSLASPPGDAQRLFVVEKNARIKVILDVTAATPATSVFLELQPILTPRSETLTTTQEQGILGLAFHPQYAQNRYFYIFYTVKKSDNTTYERLSRFTTQANDPNAADPASELILFEQLDRAINHNGGGLAFGPDGYLYVSLGDEGVANDVYGNAQKVDLNFFSGLLRIDVDKQPGSLEPTAHSGVPQDDGAARYGIPPDNPFIGVRDLNGVAINQATLRAEFWAIGMRNPWRFSFDPQTGELWLGDVGQDAWEEVNLITRGGNYGWSFREGNHEGKKTPPAGFTGVLPLYEYPHGLGNFQGYCIIGGIVYRGTALANLTGNYIFGDYVSGRIWALVRNGASVQQIAMTGGIVNYAPHPATREVLMANFDDGIIQQLVPVLTLNGLPANLSATGLFSDLSDLSPAPGVVRYSVNLPAWNDYAQSQHWFAMPNATSNFTWAQDAHWTFPTGMIWVQQLDMEMTRGNPATKRHIETRILVKTATGAYGASYLWNDAQTDATLVPNAGATIALNLTVDGNPVTKTWHVPSRADCLQCHNANAGFALSFNTRQLNRTENMNSFVGNEIDLLRQYGYFSNDPGPPDTLPRHAAPTETSYSLETRTRSYLAVNCVSCHQAGGTTGANWDVRPELSLNLTALVRGEVASNANGDAANRTLVPGDLVHSVLFNRATASEGFTRMPPLDSYETDPDGAALLAEWITQELPFWQNYDMWREVVFGSNPPPAGDPDTDDDGDGISNFMEYLAATNPLDPVEGLRLQPSSDGPNLNFQFSLPRFRGYQIETSVDLYEWMPLDLAGNNGLPPLDGNLNLVIPAPPPDILRFYRLRLWEN